MREVHFTDPVAQIGAVLDYDSAGEPTEDQMAGDRAWKVDGSCILVAPDRVLTVSHVLEEHGHQAVFFPYEGIIKLERGQSVREKQTLGDNLVLVPLKRPVDSCVPLGWKRIRSYYKQSGYCQLAGFGAWRGTALQKTTGIQTRHRVELGRPHRQTGIRWSHYDNLDLSWSSSVNDGLQTGRFNSGGAMLWEGPDGWEVVGVIRERLTDQQAGAWIGDQRNLWLHTQLGSEPTARPPGLARASDTRTVRREGRVFPFRAPPWATHARVTVSSDRGLQLQSAVVAGWPADKIRDQLVSESQKEAASGNFLVRDLEIGDGPRDLSVLVMPYAKGKNRKASVLAQVCVLFCE